MMKSYLNLIPISARVHRKQNRMTLICIILAVLLVTTIFSMADMEVCSQKIRAISDYGNWHIQLKNISESDAKLIAARSDVAASSWYNALNYRLKEDYYIGGKRTAICGVEKSLLTDIIENSIVEGVYPENENQILLTENAKEVLNINVGDTVILEIPSGETVNFTVSGFGMNEAMVLKADAIVAFMPLGVFRSFYQTIAIGELTDSDFVYYVQFKNHCNIKKAIQNIQENYNLSDDQIGQNTMLLGVMGFSNDSYLLGVYLAAIFLFLLVLTAGVLMIASSINSNVAQRTEFFGMMRCIGAEKRQIMRFVCLEALNWCKTAIPIGIAIGIVITWVMCAALRFFSPRYFSDMPVFDVSSIGIIFGIIVGLLTVLLAAKSPAKKASRVSPLAAVSGNAELLQDIDKAAYTDIVKVDISLGINHACRSKKNFVLMVGSYAFSIILFLSFSSCINFMNHAVNPLQPYSPDLSIVCEDSSCSINRSLAGSIAEMNGVKRVYGRSFVYDVPARFGTEDRTITLISYESNQFNWIDEKGWASDRIGLEKTVKDTEEGYVLVVYHPGISVREGDKIQTGLGELTVAGILSKCPFDRKDGEETLICSEALFKNLTGERNYTIIDIQLNRKATDKEVAAIREMTGDDFLFSDRRLSNKEVKGAYYSLALFVYGFLGVIAMIAVFNIMNSISMSVSARIKQYGAMRAIGMSVRQLMKMIAAEALTYAVAGSITGCIFGLLIHKFLFEQLVTARWGDAWTIPVFPLIIIVFLVIASSVAAVSSPSKRIRNMSITDTIHAL